jgi:hypothetical protein
VIGLFEKDELVTILHFSKKYKYCKDDRGNWVYLNVVKSRYVPWELRKNFIDCDEETSVSKTQIYRGKELEARRLTDL